VDDKRKKLVESQPSLNALPTPIAPSPRLAAKLSRLAAKL